MNKNFIVSKLKYLIFSFLLLAIIFSSSIIDVLSFLHNDNLVVVNIIKFIYILSLLITCIFISKKYIDFNQTKKLLPVKIVLILSAITISTIFLISGLLGFELKIIYDLGMKFSSEELNGYLVGIFVNVVKMICVTYILFGFQCFFDEITINSNKVLKYIPFSGICLMLTFGIYELILGVQELSLVYFLLNILYGIIFVLCNKNVKNTSFIISVIYIL